MAHNPFLAAAQAEDLESLLEHISWTDVLRPALIRERDILTKMLVGSTLGVPVTVATAHGAADLTREQIAGKIYGLDSVIDLIEKVLVRGQRGAEELRRNGLSLSRLYGDSSNNSISPTN